MTPGTRILVFDHLLFKNDVETPLKVTMKAATVVSNYSYRNKSYVNLVDVIFDHRPNEISKGHFYRSIELLC
jgi:hypothetical protein